MISVSDVTMRYGAKLLFEEVSVQFIAGRRFGLTGPNGAGKSTFMKILSGELEPQKGTVVRPKIDTVIMGNKGLWKALEERDAIYSKAELTDEDGMRLGELEGIVGEEDGYTAESDAAILLQGLDIPDETHERKMSELQGGQKVRVLLAQALFGRPQALLLDEPTNSLDLHPLRRHRLPDHHHLHRRLRRHGAGQNPGPLPPGIAKCSAREEDRAAKRVHRPLLRRNSFQPGDVA